MWPRQVSGWNRVADEFGFFVLMRGFREGMNYRLSLSCDFVMLCDCTDMVG